MGEKGFAEESLRAHREAELFLELADESLFVALSGFDFASREFPAAAKTALWTSLGDEGLALANYHSRY
jgi:hypothetical protein